jgi:light-regulated signal transduction histidine kinase (bacteriophytochrome)
MRELVRGLMDYSNIGSEKNLERTDCNELVKSVIAGQQSIIDQKRALVRSGELPILNVYRNEFTFLFQNLISNALKFSREGTPPEVNISCKKNKHHWEFSISDNGIGIDPKFYDKVFVIFQRLNPRSKYEGTGIGLAHCKKIVELHHGKIWVESNKNQGSTFYFTIHEK